MHPSCSVQLFGSAKVSLLRIASFFPRASALLSLLFPVYQQVENPVARVELYFLRLVEISRLTSLICCPGQKAD